MRGGQQRNDAESETLIPIFGGAFSYGIDEECNATEDGFGPLLRGGQGGTRQAVAFGWQNSASQSMSVDTVTQTLDKSKTIAVAAFKGGQGASAGGIGYDEHVSPTLSAADSGSNRTPVLMQGVQVRRLTPVECERLQGFPDHYTLVPHRGKPAADGNRYKALGNSMAVPVMAWIGARIHEVSGIQHEFVA